jgi:hypothetical protein
MGGVALCETLCPRRVDNIMVRFCLAAALVVMCLANGANARTWRVELEGTGDFTDIQPAVDAAAPGDTIRIGPGRFDTFHPITAPAWTEDTIIGVLKDNLTFIGSGKDVTILGPSAFWNPPGDSPKVFCSFGGFDAVITDMTIENVEVGIYWVEGTLEVRSCMFRALEYGSGALYLFVDSATVSDCEFELPAGGYAIEIYNLLSNIQGVNITSCAVTGADMGVRVGYGAPNIVISDSTFDVKYWGMIFDQASTGTIRRCRINSSGERAVFVTNGSVVSISDSELTDALYGLAVTENASVDASGVVISNTTGAAVYLRNRGRATVHGSHVLPASGFAVACYPYSGTPVTIDMSGNFWGTADSVAIETMIQDHADDLAIPYTVMYAPYANGPVPTESTTWGDLKALFR